MIIFHDTAKQVMPNHSWTQSRMLERATAYAVSHPCKKKLDKPHHVCTLTNTLLTTSTRQAA